LSYTYDGSHYHAAASYNSYTYTYDGNGNATARARNGVTLTFAYNGENRLTTVNSSDNSVNNSYTYDADGTRIKSANVYQNLAPGAWVYSNSTLSNNYVGADGDTYPNSGSGSSREFVNGTSGILQRYQLDLGRNYLIDKIKVWHYFPDGRTYHDTKIEIVPSGSSTWTAVFDSDQSGEYAESASGKTVTFTAQNVRGIRDWINGSTANTGNHWVELEVWGWSNIYYVNKYYEYRGHHVQSSRYYYFGDQRIAMRRGPRNDRGGMVYLATDHLGGTNITLDEANGHLLTELRYNAWGAARLASGSTATSLRYTGQREDEEIANLYDYGARWYDAYLNHLFTSFERITTIVMKPMYNLTKGNVIFADH